MYIKKPTKPSIGKTTVFQVSLGLAVVPICFFTAFNGEVTKQQLYTLPKSPDSDYRKILYESKSFKAVLGVFV